MKRNDAKASCSIAVDIRTFGFVFHNLPIGSRVSDTNIFRSLGDKTPEFSNCKRHQKCPLF